MTDVNEHSPATHDSTSIDVGRTRNERLVFIAVPLNRSETIRSSFGKNAMAINFTDDDAEWVSLALAKELGPQKAMDIGENLAKCGFCLDCGAEAERVEFDGDQLVAFCSDCHT